MAGDAGMTKRVGRPMKRNPNSIKRVPLGLRVTADIKRLVDDAAIKSGRSQSQEAERLIELGARDLVIEGLRGERDAALAKLAESERRIAALMAPLDGHEIAALWNRRTCEEGVVQDAWAAFMENRKVKDPTP